MTKVRKQKKKKTYKHSSNRRRLNKRMKRLPKIRCPEVEKAWCNSKSVRQNMQEMGLVFDTNEAFKIPTTKEILRGNTSEDSSSQQKPKKVYKPHIVENLESEVKAPREKNLRLPNSQAKWLAYLVDKYGEDYKAMEKDQHNYYQETWKQLRAKIKILRSIPGQLEEFLRK